MSTSSDLSPNSDFSLADITVDVSVNFDQPKEKFSSETSSVLTDEPQVLIES